MHSPHFLQLSKSTPWRPSTILCTSFLQVSAQEPQATQREALNRSCGFVVCDSGLWHHLHLRGQPLKKTVVLIPSPSVMQKRWMLNMVPSFLSVTAYLSRVYICFCFLYASILFLVVPIIFLCSDKFLFYFDLPCYYE